MASEITLQYHWRKTWPDRENDFTGWDGQNRIDRFYEHRAPEGIRWMWFYQFTDGDADNPQPNGMCETPREAAREIERHYDAVANGF